MKAQPGMFQSVEEFTRTAFAVLAFYLIVAAFFVVAWGITYGFYRALTGGGHDRVPEADPRLPEAS